MKKKFLAAAGVAAASVVMLTGCSGATSADMMGVKVGDGSAGHDARVHDVVFPGQTTTVGGGENVFYFPGNSRNYVISSNDADHPDRKNPSQGLTSTLTPVNVESSAYWTVNQTPAIVKDKFWPFCLKYQCASQDPNKRDANNATAGWNSMLSNNFSPAMDDAVRIVTPKFDDSVWREQKDWDKYGSALSEEFVKQLRSRTGYTDDLFCGSGDNSGWANPGKPGEGTFKCGPITVKVSSITAANRNQQASVNEANAAEQQKTANQKQLDAATAKYGSKDEAGHVLGQLDVINACKQAGASCVVVVGGQGNVNVNVPAAPATPAK